MPILHRTRERLRSFFEPMTGHDDSANAQRWRLYGWILIAVGMGFNANLFYSLGSTCAVSLAIMLVGITLDLVKLNALLTMAISWVRKETVIAFGNLVFLLLLSLISLAAGFGFWSMTNERLETQRIRESLPFIAAKNNYESANEQVKLLSKYASIDVNEERAKLEAIEVEKTTFLASTAKNVNGTSAGTVESRIGDCVGDSYYERTYCGKLRELKAALIPVQRAIANAEAYQAALKTRQQAGQDIQATSQGSGMVTAPIYTDLGRLLGKPPEVTRLILMSLITLVIEFTAIWCFVNFNRLSYYKKNIEGDYRKVTDEPEPAAEPLAPKTQKEFIKLQVPEVSTVFRFETMDIALAGNLTHTENVPANAMFTHRTERVKKPELNTRSPEEGLVPTEDKSLHTAAPIRENMVTEPQPSRPENSTALDNTPLPTALPRREEPTRESQPVFKKPVTSHSNSPIGRRQKPAPAHSKFKKFARFLMATK